MITQHREGENRPHSLRNFTTLGQRKILRNSKIKLQFHRLNIKIIAGFSAAML